MMYIQLANSMLSNTGNAENVVKYVVYRCRQSLPTMKAVQQLTGLT